MRILLLLLTYWLTSSDEYHYKYCSEVYPAIVLSKPTKKADWRKQPDIRICPDTNIDPARVSKAMNYWERLGYKFGDIIIEKDMYTCLVPPAFRREIRITLPYQGLGEKYLAATKISTHKVTGEIVQATIYITPKVSERQRVLEHEIGHALGWMHYPQSRHIMNPDWQAGGYEHYGLRK